jgi:branched-chain amino acid transport system substrate-binding protein
LSEPGIQDEAYMIKLMPASFDLVTLIAKKHATEYKKMAIVANSLDVNTGTTGNVPLFVRDFESAGGKIVFSEEFPDSESDFRALITKLKASDAQALIPFIWNAKQLATFLTQADQLRLWDKIDLAGSFVFEIMFPELIKLYPRLRSMDGLISANFRNTTSENFIEGYRLEFGTPPHQFADYGYDAISMLKKCGTELECLLQPFDGASGRVEFSKQRRRIGELTLTELREGKFVEVGAVQAP